MAKMPTWGRAIADSCTALGARASPMSGRAPGARADSDDCRGRAILGARVGGGLRRHQHPENGIDEQLAARKDEQDEDEQEAGGPRVEAEPSAQPGADA